MIPHLDDKYIVKAAAQYPPQYFYIYRPAAEVSGGQVVVVYWQGYTA